MLIALTTVLAALNSGTHAADKIEPAITAVLGSNSIPVDYDPVGSVPVASSSNTSGAFISVATGLSSNNATYAAINFSFCCSSPGTDQQYYSTLLAQGTVFTMPLAVQVGGQPAVGTPPPVTMVTASSPNSSNGGSGWGMEFGLSASYKGLDTTEDSWVSAEMSGLLVGLKSNHPTWNWFDIKGALRQTASQWATGYSSTQFGFGTIDWDSANAIASTSSLYLQGPGVGIMNYGYYAVISLYPYRQTRRSVEVLYSVSSVYSWPVKNEYTATDIAASGGTLLYTSNGTDVVPMYSYVPAVSGTVTLVAFTKDASGNYSRVEGFSKNSVVLTVGTKCTQ